MKQVYCEEDLGLTEEVLWKLEAIALLIEEVTTKKQLVEGGLDLMFFIALRLLCRSGEITDEGLETCLESLENDHADKTGKAIAAVLTQ